MSLAWKAKCSSFFVLILVLHSCLLCIFNTFAHILFRFLSFVFDFVMFLMELWCPIAGTKAHFFSPGHIISSTSGATSMIGYFYLHFVYVFFVYVHVLYSEIVYTSCLYLVLNSLSLYKHLFFCILFPLSRFLWFLNHVDALTCFEYHITIRYIIPSSFFSIETLGTMFISVGGRVEEVSISYFS